MKLLLLGDLHYPTLQDADADDLRVRQQIYEGLFRELDREDADGCVLLGDLTNSGVPADLQTVLTAAKAMRAPLYAVAGNHDTHGCSTAEFYAGLGTERYYAVELPQATLLLLDSTLESCLDDWLGVLDEPQYNWLQQKVRESTKPVFVVAHHPVCDTTRRSDERRLQLHADMWRVLGQRSGGVYLNGHNHYHSIAEQQGWLFVQTGDFPSHMDYRVLEFDGERVTVTTRSLRDRLPAFAQLAPKMPRYTLYTDLVYNDSELARQFQLK